MDIQYLGGGHASSIFFCSSLSSPITLLILQSFFALSRLSFWRRRRSWMTTARGRRRTRRRRAGRRRRRNSGQQRSATDRRGKENLLFSIYYYNPTTYCYTMYICLSSILVLSPPISCVVVVPSLHQRNSVGNKVELVFSSPTPHFPAKPQFLENVHLSRQPLPSLPRLWCSFV